jgi:inosine/xanthosine triphosphate pyrophosphatase family protein
MPETERQQLKHGGAICDRAARFVFAVTIASSNGHVWTSEDELGRTIVGRRRETGGPDFVSMVPIPGFRTLAKLLNEEKHPMSRRANSRVKPNRELNLEQSTDLRRGAAR